MVSAYKRVQCVFDESTRVGNTSAMCLCIMIILPKIFSQNLVKMYSDKDYIWISDKIKFIKMC